MRLIDADALITEAFDLMDRDELREDVPQIIKDYCDAQPTVEAIPVEWIEQYKQSIGSQTLMGYRWIEIMQKAWAERRKE